MKTLDVLMIAAILISVQRADSDNLLDLAILAASAVWLVCFVLRMVKNDD